MSRAGYCSECGAKVQLREDDSCEHGHPAASISRRYYAAPTAAHVESAQAKPPRRKRSRAAIVTRNGKGFARSVLPVSSPPSFSPPCTPAGRSERQSRGFT